MDKSIESLFSHTIRQSLRNWQSDHYGRFQICFGGLCDCVASDSAFSQKLITVDSHHAHSVQTVAALRASPDQMPFRSHSVNLLILPLTLDMCSSPERVIREAERVIADDGRIVIYGINPWSPWNILRRLSGGSDDLAHRKQQLSRRRVKEWLRLLDFDIERQTSLLYGLSQEQSDKERRLDRLGRLFLPGCGLLYGIQAIKRTAPVSITKVALKRFSMPPVEPVGSWRQIETIKNNRHS